VNANARNIVAACQRNLLANSNNCSGFVRAVAKECNVLLVGDANSITGQLSRAKRVLSSGQEAARAAAAGYLVVGGVKSSGHGHVVIVVDGPLSRGKYPYCFWGQYHGITLQGETLNVGFTRGHGTLNWAFGPKTRDTVVYAAYSASLLMLSPAAENEGLLIYTFK
jgi:hypothetical protein